MNDIAIKLISGQIDTLQALFLARESATGELKNFIERELDGYPLDEELPEYRNFSCPVVLDYQTPWGQVYREVELDTTLLNEKGFSVNQSLFFDDFSFIQNNVNALTSNSGIRPFNVHLLEMLRKVVTTNPPNSIVISGGHKFQKQQIQSILDTVKKELIKKLQDQTPIKETAIKLIPQSESQKKIVFVSYAWESDLENRKVISFVNFLREKGYDARMDISVSQKETATNFKKMMHEGIYNSDKVIVILSEKYKRKADNLEDGVGEEVKIIQEEISKKTNKYILVSFCNLSKDVIAKIQPNSLCDRNILDLKKDQDEKEFSDLFAKLNSTPIIEFSDIGTSIPEVEKLKIESFKL